MTSELASLEDLLALRLGLSTLSEPFVPPMSQAVADAAMKAWNSDLWRDSGSSPAAVAGAAAASGGDGALLDWQSYQYANLLMEDLTSTPQLQQRAHLQQDTYVADSLEALQHQLNVLQLQQQQQHTPLPQHSQLQQHAQLQQHTQLQQQHELQRQSQAIKAIHPHGVWQGTKLPATTVQGAPLATPVLQRAVSTPDEDLPVPGKDLFQQLHSDVSPVWGAQQHVNLPPTNTRYQQALSLLQHRPIGSQPTYGDQRQSWDRERFQRHVQRASGARGGRGQYRNPRRSASHIIPRAPTWAEPNWHPMAVVVQSGQLANGGTGVFLPGIQDDKEDGTLASAAEGEQQFPDHPRERSSGGGGESGQAQL